MVNGIGGSGAGKAAIEAALKSMRARAGSIGAESDAIGGSKAEGSSSSGFAEALKEGLSTVDSEVTRAGELHQDVLAGRLDIHEAATAIKESKITFQFALQVRNKLMDAYREVMRMSV